MLKFIEKIYEDGNPDMYKVLYQLTTEEAKEFNERIGKDDKVYYQVFYTTMKDISNDPFLLNGYSYLKKISGENDGLVSEYSARWGDNIEKIEGGISHWQIVDYKRRTDVSGTNVLGFYLVITDELAKKGF